MSIQAIICFGSNHGNRRDNICDALQHFGIDPQDLDNYSGIYNTDDESSHHAPYLNAVARIQTDKTLHDLVESAKEYERTHGRKSSDKQHGTISIDIDIVYYDGKVVRIAESRTKYFNEGLAKISK